ncbi:MAG: hypothetical protein U9R25_06715 [Chloroflexota bacterium]|nr:hypothetical protein [Chloroflexota bacterium]
MSYDLDTIYELLPAIYRLRDAEEGDPLKALLGVISEQTAILEENLAQLYDDQFIETCADWVVPYIGDLIGYRTLHGVTPEVSSPRAEVANTIGYRRRKGTAAMLEQLARDVTGWNARVVEFFELLATSQYMKHLRLHNLYSPAMRDWEALERLDTAFDRVAHTADVRRIGGYPQSPRSERSAGKFNIPNVGIYLWRLDSHKRSRSPAVRIGPRRYMFSPLGKNTPLYNRVETEDEITHLAEPINVPMALSRRVLDSYLALHYGPGKGILLTAGGVEIDRSQVVVCNLSDKGAVWAHKPADKYAIDPVLGRVATPQNTGDPGQGILTVTFHYGFSADLGGGEYARADDLDEELAPVMRVPTDEASIQAALAALGGHGVVEVQDSGPYDETPHLTATAGSRLELRAADGSFPHLLLGGELVIDGGDEAEVTVDGLLISAAAVRITGNLRRVTLRHCTLVPGHSLFVDGRPRFPDAASLIVDAEGLILEIDRCILGGLRVDGQVAEVRIVDSIVDATSPDRVAYAALDGEGPGAQLTVVDSTVIGKVHTRLLELASNTIFHARLDVDGGDTWLAPVLSQRRQEGCVRFSFVPFRSVTPRRFQCQPAREEDMVSMRPVFNSQRYGDPDYCQLNQRCPVEIRTGADDESEMGVFHDLYQPQKETNLRVRLDEYLRFGLEAGIFYAS